MVEDDEAVGRTLVRLITQGGAYSTVVASCAVDARRAFADGNADVRWLGFVVDVGLPEGSRAGLELLAYLREQSPETPAVVVTGELQRDVANSVAALDASFVCKPPSEAELAPFIARVHARASGRPDAGAIAAAASRRFGLTQREREVVECALRGDSTDDFCARAMISPRTFRAHSANVLSKTHARSLHAFAMQLMREHLLRSP